MKTSPIKKFITVMALGLVLIITGCCAGAPKPEVTGGTSYQLTFKDCLPVAGEKASSWAPCPSNEGLPCTATYGTVYKVDEKGQKTALKEGDVFEEGCDYYTEVRIEVALGVFAADINVAIKDGSHGGITIEKEGASQYCIIPVTMKCEGRDVAVECENTETEEGKIYKAIKSLTVNGKEVEIKSQTNWTLSDMVMFEDGSVCLIAGSDKDLTGGTPVRRYTKDITYTDTAAIGSFEEWRFTINEEEGRISDPKAEGRDVTFTLSYPGEADIDTEYEAAMGMSDGEGTGINILDLLNNLPAVGDNGCVHQYAITEQQQGVCETPGHIIFTCTKCGSQYRQTLNPPGHQYEITETTATCTTAGSTKYTCKVCGAVTEKTGEALGHDYSLTKEVAPECEKIGYKEYTCSRCQKTVTEETEKLDHLLSSVGSPEDYQGHYMGCSRCGNPRASLVSHSLIYTWTEDLYTQKGDRAHVKACTVCGWKNVEECSDNSPANGYCAYCGRPRQ